MRLASFPSPAAFLRWCMLLVLGMAGGFAPAQALTNGGFEAAYVPPTIQGWLKSQFLNPGLAGATPYNGNSIVRNAGGSDFTSVLTTLAGTETQADSNLGAGETLKWPKFGTSSVLINQGGSGRNGNALKQTFTLDSSMLDTADGRLHIRFAFAPVLQNPGHAVSQQPFFHIGVKDMTAGGITLYDNLNFSNQPGSPWKSAVSGSVLYTDWQIKDIALDPAVYQDHLIEVEFLAAGCSLGGHYGKLYTDGVAAVIPGLWVSVSSSVLAPPLAVGGTIRYTYTVRNTGATPQTNVNINAIVPVNTTFVALTDPGLQLSQSGGVISSTAPFPTSGFTMAPGDSYIFSVDVTVNAGTPAGTEITSGNYYAQADNYGSLYGSPVKNYVNGAGTDLAVSMTAGLGASTCNTQFTITITNNGPNTAGMAQASLPLPANTTLVGATTTMGLVTGANPVVASLGDLASGGTATFTVVVRPTTTAAISGTVTVSGNFTDTVPANDTASASYANASGGAAVSITTQPAGGTFASGSTPTLTVAASGGCGGLTYQWYLNGVAIGGATGASYTTPALGAGIYNYTARVTEGSGYYVISNAATVTVNATVTASAGPNGTLDGTTPSPVSVAPDGTSTATFKFSANLGYHVASVSGCNGPVYTNTSNAVTSYTYITGGITADCTVTATFAINTYQVSASAGANGSLDITTPSPVTINYGSTASFTFNASPNYHIASISGCSGPLYTNTSNAVTSYTYTTGAITAGCAVTATFAINTFTITATSSANGTISPSGAVVVTYGANQTFTLTPNAAFGVLDVLVDGVSVGALASYTFLSITTDHTIAAVFATGEEEPNNNYVQATRVAAPGAVTGRMFVANDLDYYRVVLPVGATLTATLTPPPGGNSYFLYIYNQAGRIVAQSTLGGGSVNVASIRNSGIAPFYFYAVVRSPWGFSNPNWYRLNLNW